MCNISHKETVFTCQTVPGRFQVTHDIERQLCLGAPG